MQKKANKRAPAKDASFLVPSPGVRCYVSPHPDFPPVGDYDGAEGTVLSVDADGNVTVDFDGSVELFHARELGW